MSHHATNWAIQQRGLKPATKIVLWHLADRHNPDHGCFPEQARLAADCEIGRTSLNAHLDELERLGLIRRVRRVNPETHKQMSTRYILGFEDDFPQEPCSEAEHGEGRRNGGEPCSENRDSRVRNPNTNPVREPLSTTTCASGLDTASSEPESRDVVVACLEACGPGLSSTSRRLVAFSADVIDGWIADGVDLDLDVLPVLRDRTADAADRVIRTWDYFSPAVREAHQNRLRCQERRAAAEKPAAVEAAPLSPEAVLQRMADWINSDSYVPPSAVSTSMRVALIERGLVTKDRLRARQIY